MSEFTFKDRHIGPSAEEIEEMLKTIGVDSVDELIAQTIPASIRLKNPLNLPEGLSEYDFLNELRLIAANNKVFNSYIGMGYYNTIMPTVIQRNVFENPGWYTAYTPYQAEIAQGRLEALLNFQTMIIDLTGMEIANASLLDEATAAAESMIMMHHANTNKTADGKEANMLFVSNECFPQTIDVLKTRANPLGIELVIGNHKTAKLDESYFGAIVQYPAGNGEVYDYTIFVNKAHEKGIQVAVAADIMSLVILKAPGQWGADIVFGSTQRFGVPEGYGGPHAAFFAAKEHYKRNMPGRIIGVSQDVHGNRAYRMALQTREQHIRRDKATSNICTAQVLLAVIAGMYAVYHGPKGLSAIAKRIHDKTTMLAKTLKSLGYTIVNEDYFDTLTIRVSSEQKKNIQTLALKQGINFNYFKEGFVAVSIDEPCRMKDLRIILSIFASANNKGANDFSIKPPESNLPENLKRNTPYLTHPVFNSHHSETEMLRYITRLENKDLSLNHSMIALGSCTMKLNATSEMMPLSWRTFSFMHPFAPADQVKGYAQVIHELESYLCEITGFAGISLQPNSGAQGEYAGLLVIRAYHHSRNDFHRNVVLIPASAHGTNPATAVMCGMKVVVVKCESQGDIDVKDLKEKAILYKDDLAALMVTYPSTHGVFEENIKEITEIIHDNGGQVYMDGANMNAQVGLTNPAMIGADVCHINLHKTFAIPHGGGGPGMGPIGVAKHLVPFLPSHAVIETGGTTTAVSAAPWGSASILLISYAYMKMLGGDGVTEATKMAILNVNYIKSRLENHYPVLYKGKNGRVAHEMILDCRQFKLASGVEVEDIAKRLMDYGFHAPTVSFPVAGTLMIEPTESEPKDELDKFCEALIAIRKEVEEIIDGHADKVDNVLKNAPHTAMEALSDDWKHPYSRTKAVYPAPWLKENKFWVSVGRVDNAFGDRNFVCQCPPTESYVEEPVS
ncbi:MAG: aminomethyl-transferring glycine dehydrogenase [Bacteroidota bacterium]